MKSYISKKEKLNLIIMNIVLAITILINKHIEAPNTIIQIIVSIIAAICSYEFLTIFIYNSLINKKSLFKFYWGKFYLEGFWYYEYTIKDADDKKYYGFWEIKQDLENIVIIGYGYADNSFEIRTRLTSITELVESNKCYDVVHIKKDMSDPSMEFYAKSSISFSDSETPLKTFRAITTIHGVNNSNETHIDTFTKVSSEEDVITQIKRKRSEMSVLKQIIIKNQLTAIVVIGRTASGKTTTAKKIAEVLDYKYIACGYYKRLLKAPYDKNDSMNDDLRDRGLELALNESIECLEKNHSIVLDSSFGVKARRRRLIERLVTSPVDNILFVYCLSANIEETKNRIERRKGKEHIDIQYHASDYKIFEHINKTFEEPDISELACVKGSKFIFYVDTFSHDVKIVEKNNDKLVSEVYDQLRTII